MAQVQIEPGPKWHRAEQPVYHNELQLLILIKVILIKLSKGAKIRNRYNQVPHLTQDTNEEVTNSQLDTTNESQEVSPLSACDHKARINRRAQIHTGSKHRVALTAHVLLDATIILIKVTQPGLFCGYTNVPYRNDIVQIEVTVPCDLLLTKIANHCNEVSKGAKIRNRYNQVPHLTQDTNGKVTNSQ